jgi:hypothetical protein
MVVHISSRPRGGDCTHELFRRNIRGFFVSLQKRILCLQRLGTSLDGWAAWRLSAEGLASLPFRCAQATSLVEDGHRFDIRGCPSSCGLLVFGRENAVSLT